MKEWIIKLLQKWSCMHNWELKISRDVKSYSETYTSYTYVCEKCGKFKRWKSS
jgi:hypothetical protein